MAKWEVLLCAWCFSYAFCDFGPEFTIMDPDGEEPIECFIGKITKVSKHANLWGAVDWF